ncbi:MAG TPA: hypothetical protein VMR25_14600 [Planctomycetaceae bacterium]|nr:hypothetical protein [Planctomycetaceae bacterium]
MNAAQKAIRQELFDEYRILQDRGTLAQRKPNFAAFLSERRQDYETALQEYATNEQAFRSAL